MTATLSARETTIDARTFTRTAGTRERGRQAYQRFKELVEQALVHVDSVAISFIGFEYVGPAFLDETVIRFLEEHPEFQNQIQIHGLCRHGKDALMRNSQHAGLDINIK